MPVDTGLNDRVRDRVDAVRALNADRQLRAALEYDQQRLMSDVLTGDADARRELAENRRELAHVRAHIAELEELLLEPL